MKNLLSILLLPMVFILSACSCQGQPHPIASSNDTTTVPTEVLRNLIPDSIAVASLTEDDRNVLNLRYAGDPSVISYRVIKNPFPQADSLTVFRKLQCNMSATRTFVAERTSISFDYTGNRPDLVWRGKLVGTGYMSNRVDFNIINLDAVPDSSVQGGYRFFYGNLKVSNTEAYEFETFPPYPYFVLIHYNPSKLPLAACNGTTPPVTTTR